MSIDDANKNKIFCSRGFLRPTEIVSIESIDSALEEASETAQKLDDEVPQPVLCIGSIYLIGAILEILGEDSLVDFQNILISPSGEDGIDPIA